MNKLAALLKEQIRTTGPLSLYDYMQTALSHPEFGYYQQAAPFGANGDFVTAPEISQMFGELVGLWCVDAWVKLGSPTHINLVELGPGNGTLMRDALRSAALVPEFLKAAKIHLVETSDRLTNIQQQHLSNYDVQWHKIFPDLPDACSLIIGNEFLDALPIHQFECRDCHWHEKQITLSNDLLLMTTSNDPTGNDKFDLPDPTNLENETIVEVNPAAKEITSQICDTLMGGGGAALFIDYGPLESGFGDSFQAVRNHNYANPLENPGETDLTAHVDFATLKKIAEDAGCLTLPITSQGRFLERLGVEARAFLLSKKATEEQKEKISQDLRRLISSEGMGTLFKAFSFYHTMTAPPAGFGE